MQKTVRLSFVTVLVACAATVIYFGFTIDTNRIVDCMAYYMAGEIARGPERSRLYDQEVEKTLFRSFKGAHYPGEEYLVIVYPPHTALAMVPLSALDYPLASRIWTAINMLSVVAGIGMLWRTDESFSKRLPGLFLFSIAVIGSLPGYRAITLGQPSWLIAFIAALACYAMIYKRAVLSPLSLFLSTMKFQYAPFLAVGFACERRWRDLILAALFTGVVGAVCIFWFGADIFQKYVAFISRVATEPQFHPAVNPESMINLRSLLTITIGEQAATNASVIMTVIGLCSSTAVWLAARRYGLEGMRWALAYSILCTLIWCPHVHLYDGILAIVPAVLTMSTLDPFAVTDIPCRYTRLWHWLFMIYPLLPWVVVVLDLGFLHLSRFTMGFSYSAIGCILLLNCILSFLCIQIVLKRLPLAAAIASDASEHSPI